MSQARMKPRTIGQQETDMRTDIASHLPRSGPDELVPSRYAVQVGDIDVLVVSDGVITPPAAAMASGVSDCSTSWSAGHSLLA